MIPDDVKTVKRFIEFHCPESSEEMKAIKRIEKFTEVVGKELNEVKDILRKQRRLKHG